MVSVSSVGALLLSEAVTFSLEISEPWIFFTGSTDTRRILGSRLHAGTGLLGQLRGLQQWCVWNIFLCCTVDKEYAHPPAFKHEWNTSCGIRRVSPNAKKSNLFSDSLECWHRGLSTEVQVIYIVFGPYNEVAHEEISGKKSNVHVPAMETFGEMLEWL